MKFAAVVLVMLVAVAPAVFAAQFPVAWNLGTDYSPWTTRSFNANDTLVFTYDSTHTVDVVSKSDYDNCNSANPISTATSSPTTITLGEGTTYIICGTPGHCSGGMKLQATVRSSGSGGRAPRASPTPSPSSSPTTPAATSPSGSTTPSATSPTGSTTPGSSAPPPSAATGLSAATHMMLGLPLALGALFAFMG